MSYPDKLFLVVATEETLYLKDKKDNHYALNHCYADKSCFRDFVGVEPTHTYKDEDGDVCYEYDDDSWELETEHLLDYVNDYVKKKYKIFNDVYDNNYRDEDIFRVSIDDEWYEDMVENLKRKECQKTQ